MFDPLPWLFKKSRFWFIRNISRLLTSGTHRVEFTDFWLGDQFCSLVFTLSNLYFVVCVYVRGFENPWGRCAASKNFGIPLVLAALPLFVRFVQSVKRWFDSRLVTHLINGGKYAAGIVQYGLYYNWRYHGSARSGASFALYCLFATIYSTYALTWDFLMDWSVLRLPPRTKYPLLRDELLYSDHIPVYYFAIITNVMIRFIWLLYVPAAGPNFVVRTFIAAMLEMLRRWQWNFYRLENEHLGNMDQYRVTREVPLPYAIDERLQEGDYGEDGDESDVPARSWHIREWKGRARGSIRPGIDQH
ncbi:EXS-domain-containing protein [Neolentinus lepideus HHB14362 ss-1]|uniref:EXS-domain-containing protein n=1 Tax=Neolentinus lepideus HHB14362 ss-1 TaxID=1314782 RepID=A0A165REI1_9AGAM|nr:EXS-domain-containing protein [Neolentinus lepideus HHB14362 ss-1]